MVLSKQAHPAFSPVGWHLGHIAYTEALWILEETGDRAARLFAADGLPKSERQNLPSLTELLDYLDSVRSQVINTLEQSDIEPRLMHWLLQHEGQHAETMAMVMAMHHANQGNGRSLLRKLPRSAIPRQTILDSGQTLTKGGAFCQGSDADDAIDNERPAHRASVDDFWIDTHLVTCGQFAQFMAAGGYEKREWWSLEGWAWQQKRRVREPMYWDQRIEGVASDSEDLRDRAVCGVSAYEAEAYARSLGKRLPTESEWERAAASGQCSDMFGSVWQWTATEFDEYAGFTPFPYAGYSQIYFDGEHRVLKGSSWASPTSIVRKSFRNWYHPHRRELFAGFRCARSVGSAR